MLPAGSGWRRSTAAELLRRRRFRTRWPPLWLGGGLLRLLAGSTQPGHIRCGGGDRPRTGTCPRSARQGPDDRAVVCRRGTQLLGQRLRREAETGARGIPQTQRSPAVTGLGNLHMTKLTAQVCRRDLHVHAGVLGHQQATTAWQRTALHLAADEALVGVGVHHQQWRVRLMQ